MTLVQLRHLIALAETGSFSRAAQAQFLTQPALSRSIRALEDELGMPLFDRVGRRTELTAFGRATLERARLLVSDAEELQGSGRRSREGERGTLRIGMECHPCYQWLLKVVSPYLAQWPDVDVDVKQKFQFGGIEIGRAHV